MARKSIVVLKNEGNLLPLSKSVKNLAVIGALADDADAPLGAWKAQGNAKDVVTVLAGIKQAVTNKAAVHYEAAYDVKDFRLTGLGKALEIASKSELILAVVGETANMSGEAASRSDIGLPGEQQLLLEALKNTGKPVVVLLMNGRPLAISWIEANIPAILEGWFLGVEMGHAVSDVLFGDFNPSGRLTTTFPRTVGQIPIYYNHKNTGRPGNDAVQFSSRYLDLPITPLYPFGFGLSYSTFEIGEPRLNKAQITVDDSLYITVEVRNAGKRAGVETVQLYIQDVAASMTRPVKELKRFKQVSLKAGEAQTIRFALGFNDLAFYNQQMQWVVEPGKFRVFAGANSADVKAASFEVIR
jgi:beta-glucosidase